MMDDFRADRFRLRRNTTDRYDQGMEMRTAVSRAALFSFLFWILCSSAAIAQMPDWVMLRDRDGNRYYADQNGRLYCSGKPEFDFKPVSAEGIDYYYQQGLALLAGHYKAEGLTLLKSILALPATSMRITDIQAKASLHVNALAKREGERYDLLSREASLLLFREGKEVTLANDAMRYSLKTSGKLTVIRRRVREGGKGYFYHGLLMGIRFIDDSPASGSESGYDMLIAVDSERFAHEVGSAARLEQSWRKNLGWDTFRRTVLEKDTAKIIYSFVDDAVPQYSGFEGFFVRDSFGYCVRAISSKRIFDSRRDKIAAIVKGFKI